MKKEKISSIDITHDIWDGIDIVIEKIDNPNEFNLIGDVRNDMLCINYWFQLGYSYGYNKYANGYACNQWIHISDINKIDDVSSFVKNNIFVPYGFMNYENFIEHKNNIIALLNKYKKTS